MIAVRLASRVAAIVALAGPTVDGRQLLLAQTAALARASGTSAEIVERMVAINRGLYDLTLEGASADAITTYLREQRAALPPTAHALYGIQEEREPEILASLDHAWFRGFLAYDPTEDLSAVEVPMLAIFGGKDAQVPAELNAEALRKANPQARVEIHPGLNHLLQTATTGTIAEYGTIEETLAPAVLEQITGWILRQTR